MTALQSADDLRHCDANRIDEHTRRNTFCASSAVPPLAGLARRDLRARCVEIVSEDWDDHEGYYKNRLGETMGGRYVITSESVGKGVFSNVVKAKAPYSWAKILLVAFLGMALMHGLIGLHSHDAGRGKEEGEKGTWWCPRRLCSCRSSTTWFRSSILEPSWAQFWGRGGRFFQMAVQGF